MEFRNPLGGHDEANKRRRVIASMDARDRECFAEDLDAAQEINLQTAENASRTLSVTTRNKGLGYTIEDLESRNRERDVLHGFTPHRTSRPRKRQSVHSSISSPRNPLAGKKRPHHHTPRNKPTRHVEEYEEEGYADMDWESFEDGLDVTSEFCFISSMQGVQETEAIEFSIWEDESKLMVPDLVENVFTRENNMQDALEGDEIVDLWFNALAKIEAKINLSQQQKDFIHCCFLSLLPLIYGDQFEPNIVRLCKRFNIDAMYKKVFFEMPRRFGKTTAVSIVAAECAYVLKKKISGEGNTIGIFSVVKSASDSITEAAIGYYEVITRLDPKDFVESWDKQKGRVVLVSHYGDFNIIWGFSAVSNVRIPSFHMSVSLLRVG